MFKMMGKKINAILGARTILIWTNEVGIEKNDNHIPPDSSARKRQPTSNLKSSQLSISQQ